MRTTLVAAFLLLLGAAPVYATVTRALSLRELVDQADVIAVARAVGEDVHWHDGRIVTDVTMSVETSMKGAPAGSEIVVRRFGGAIGDLGMRIEGEPAFPAGDACVLFARRFHGVLRPVGMSQGVMPVQIEAGRPMVLPGGAGLALVSPQLRPAPAALMHPRPLGDVVDEIRVAVEEARGR